MSRLFLLIILAALVVAAAAYVVAGVTTALRDSSREVASPGRASGVQKVAYTALVVLLFGIASGWLGEG